MSRNDLFKAFKDGEYGKVKNLLENDTITGIFITMFPWIIPIETESSKN
jgi:hypothetical protein